MCIRDSVYRVTAWYTTVLYRQSWMPRRYAKSRNIVKNSKSEIYKCAVFVLSLIHICIYAFFMANHTDKEKVRFLKDEYGIGGLSHALSGATHSGEDHDGKGLHYKTQMCIRDSAVTVYCPITTIC